MASESTVVWEKFLSRLLRQPLDFIICPLFDKYDARENTGTGHYAIVKWTQPKNNFLPALIILILLMH